MKEYEDENEGNVDITVEITGKYDDVVPRLQQPTPERESVSTVMADLSVLLDTVVRIGGGTKSVIAEELPEELEHRYDAEGVVDALRLLARYDIVVLDGNTWTPGPTLQE